MSMKDRATGESTLIEITDGEGDRGIDALAVEPVTNLVVVVQSKWRKDGSGSVDLGSTLKFIDGIRSLLDIESEGVANCSEQAKAAVRIAMRTPGARLKMVIATTAANDLSEEVRRPFNELLAVLNDIGEDPIADVDVLTQSTFFDSLSQPTREAVDLSVQLLDWGRTLEPVPSYYGRASAAEVATWFAQNGVALFAENIRVVLPRSEINDGILQTISENPARFWYYNNGITVLATKIDRGLTGTVNRDAIYLQLKDASVVNGAQTVSTLGRALAVGKKEELESAYVTIRCIEVASDNEDLARSITRYANTQNVVSAQDFVFLDEEQHRLTRELRVLGYEYILRSGETATSQDLSRVLDVRQAAVALACASREVSHAVLAKREVSRLFDRAGSGVYKALFNPTVNGLLVQRAVDIVREIDDVLDSASEANEGVRSGVAVHGRRLIAHVILNEIGRKKLSDPDFGFEAAVQDIAVRAVELLDAMADNFPANSYPGNVFKNQARCVELMQKSGVAI
ncbi:MAG: AIPR family protein [Saccharothrix sp.]|nr:AIPR family protein [Saccharothrix sp.]